MSRVKISEYKGKEITCIDFSACGRKETENTIEEVKKLIQLKKTLYVLANVTNMDFTPGVIESLQAFAGQYRANITAMAILGLSGLEKLTFQLAAKSLGTCIEVFSISENRKAVDWLVGF